MDEVDDTDTERAHRTPRFAGSPLPMWVDRHDRMESLWVKIVEPPRTCYKSFALRGFGDETRPEGSP